MYPILYIPPITSQPMNRVSAPVLPPSQTTASSLTPSKSSSILARTWPPSASPHSLNHRLQVCTLMASKCISPNLLHHSLQVDISRLAPSWRPSASGNSLDYRPQVCMIAISKFLSQNSHNYILQVHTITVSKCIPKLARSQPSGVSPTSVDYGLQVCMIIRSESIAKFARSRRGETAESEGILYISNTPPHIAYHPKCFFEEEPFWLEGYRKSVRGYERIPGHDDPH